MQGLPELLLGLAVGAFVTYVAWERSDGTKAHEAAESNKRYQQACVRDFQNGWRYDKCEHDAILDLKAGEESFKRCTDLIMRTNWTLDDFDAACGRGAEQRNGK